MSANGNTILHVASKTISDIQITAAIWYKTHLYYRDKSCSCSSGSCHHHLSYHPALPMVPRLVLFFQPAGVVPDFIYTKTVRSLQ